MLVNVFNNVKFLAGETVVQLSGGEQELDDKIAQAAIKARHAEKVIQRRSQDDDDESGSEAGQK